MAKVFFLFLSLFFVACSEQKVAKLDTKEFVKLASSPSVVIIDTREDSLFNGFKEEGFKRGGHIPNAVQFSLSWVDKIDADKFESFSAGKGITKDKQLIFYGSNKSELNQLAQEFSHKGYKVSVYENFKEYANDESLPLKKYANYGLAVSAKWLKNALNSNNAPMVFEVSWGQNSASYLSHIVGAYHFDTDLVESPPVWNLKPLDELRKALASVGVGADSSVVLYSDNQLAALRVLLAMKVAGVRDVRYLNGGLLSWRDMGGKVETKVNEPSPLASFGEARDNLALIISSPDDALNLQQNAGLKLISNRSWDEYIGKTSGYDYIPGKGEPAGAIWGFAGTDSSNVADYYDPDGTLRNPDEIFALWQGQGFNEKDKIAFYCGTGWRASVSWFLAYLAGWENAKVYDGGWNAWQMDSKYPVQVGAPNGISKPDSKNDYGKIYKAGGSCKG